jgi:MYND finger
VTALKEPMHQFLKAALTTMKKDRVLDEGFIAQAPHQSDAQYWADVRGRLDLALTQANTHAEIVTQALPVINPQRTSLTSRYRRCANAACSNLTGYSERRTKSKMCSSCGVARYCSVACQTVHWKAGHRDECSWLLTVRENGS